MSDNKSQTPIENQSGSSRPRSSRLKKGVLILLFLVVAGLSLYPIVALYFASESLDSEMKKEVWPEDIAYDVVMVLVNWEVFGDYPTDPASFQKSQNSLLSRITGIRGFSERGSFPFSEDGADWYELNCHPTWQQNCGPTLKTSSLSIKVAFRRMFTHRHRGAKNLAIRFAVLPKL